MKYAVEARIFYNGKIVAKMRPAEPGEENNYHETRTCDVWTDVFDEGLEAEEFLKGYKRA